MFKKTSCIIWIWIGNFRFSGHWVTMGISVHQVTTGFSDNQVMGFLNSTFHTLIGFWQQSLAVSFLFLFCTMVVFLTLPSTPIPKWSVQKIRFVRPELIWIGKGASGAVCSMRWKLLEVVEASRVVTWQ